MYKNFTKELYKNQAQYEKLSKELKTDQVGVPSVTDILNRYASGLPVGINFNLSSEADTIVRDPLLDGDSDILEATSVIELMNQGYIDPDEEAQDIDGASPANVTKKSEPTA